MSEVNLTFVIAIILIIVIIVLPIGIQIGKTLGKSKIQNQIKDAENSISQLHIKLDMTQKRLQEEKKNRIEELQKTERQYQYNLEEIKAEKDQLRHAKEGLNNELIKLKTEYINLEKQADNYKSETQKLQDKFKEEFENLAQKILEQKSEKFTALNKTNIENILLPLQKRIKQFEDEVKENKSQSIKRHAQLNQHLETLNLHNIQISQEAKNLTKALKGESKTQGNWGEKILERVLEKSGLEKGREYYVQQSFETENGKRLQPDIVIQMPQEKQMIIDAKVSLTAYEKYINEEDKIRKRKYLKRHIASLKNHISELQSKQYEELLAGKSPDFILMFVPIGPALFKAQEEDLSFFNTAFHKNILLVTPTTLLATLRTVDALWSNNKQHQNAQKIAKHAGSLYHKFYNLIEALKNVEKSIDKSKESYQNAMKKLTGKQNLIKDIDKLKKLGISTKNELDQNWINKIERTND